MRGCRPVRTTPRHRTLDPKHKPQRLLPDAWLQRPKLSLAFLHVGMLSGLRGRGLFTQDDVRILLQSYRPAFDRGFGWSVGLLFFSLPLFYGLQNAALGAAGVCWLLGGQWRGAAELFRTRRALGWWWVMAALGALSLLYTTNIAEGVTDWTRKLPMVIVPLILGLSQRASPHLTDRWLLAFVRGNAASALLCTGTAFLSWAHGGSPYFAYDPLVAPVDEIAVTAAWKCAMALLILAAHEFSTVAALSKRGVRLALFALLFVFFTMLSARTLLVATVCLLNLLVLLPLGLKRLRGFRELKIAIPALTLALIGYLFTDVSPLRRRFQDLSGFNASGSGRDLAHADNYNKRMAVWKATWENLEVSPAWIIGVGPGDVRTVQAARVTAPEFRYKQYENLRTLQTYKVDNMYLQTWLGLGLPGLFAFCAMLLSGLVLALRARFLVGIAFFLITGLFCVQESLLQSQNGVLMLTLFSSLTIVVAALARKAELLLHHARAAAIQPA